MSVGEAGKIGPDRGRGCGDQDKAVRGAPLGKMRPVRLYARRVARAVAFFAGAPSRSEGRSAGQDQRGRGSSTGLRRQEVGAPDKAATRRCGLHARQTHRVEPGGKPDNAPTRDNRDYRVWVAKTQVLPAANCVA